MPHLVETFKPSTDWQAFEKVGDVVGPYLDRQYSPSSVRLRSV
jgi:hypothetical protein